jgi:hypothetical protein
VGGIVTNGWDQTLIENNVIDGCYGSAVSHNNPTTGVDRGSTVGVSVPGSGYKTILKNNTIKNTKSHSKGGKGYGVYNKISTNIFDLYNNTFSNNPGGNTYGININFKK